MTAPCALIFGITGQDGALLARRLTGMGYSVHGTSRDPTAARLGNLAVLGLADAVTLHETPASQADMAALITRISPGEIYALSGQSSVAHALSQPLAAFESIATNAMMLLDTLVQRGAPTRLVYAGSGDCFGQASAASPATEGRAFAPRSPYAIAKAAAAIAVSSYREVHGMHAATALLFNHESPLRPDAFVTRKVVRTAVRIARGDAIRLEIGDLSVVRDWGWADEYVDAMWRMQQQDTPQDFIIATGKSHRLQDFVDGVFAALDLDWRAHTDINPAFFRKGDVTQSHADPSAAASQLGWRAQVHLPELIARLVAAEQARPA